jgi:uncharacterized protein
MTPTKETFIAKRHETQQITTDTDSREILANARRDIERYKLDAYYIVDVDAHHVEFDSWDEVLDQIEDPVLRRNGKVMAESWPNARRVAFSNHTPGLTFQDVHGRIPHQIQLREEVDVSDGRHRDLTLVGRVLESMGIDVQILFPQPMLEIGTHPDPGMEIQLVTAYNRWFTERILGHEPRIKSMLALPFGSPEASLRTIREFAGKPGVVGFLITSQRQIGVHRPEYFPVYKELEERGLPLGFHAGFDPIGRQVNRFVSVHSLSFVACNLVHLTNWVMNGLPERFPKLNVIWIESGLAWLPFIMQRLDHEFLMRQSDAPLLKKLPGDYMRGMYYTSQPMEATNLRLLQSTFEAINAETQLLFSSDWPHWDFDVPGKIAGLPFLNEHAKRNILGETARRLFRL